MARGRQGLDYDLISTFGTGQKARVRIALRAGGRDIILEDIRMGSGTSTAARAPQRANRERIAALRERFDPCVVVPQYRHTRGSEQVRIVAHAGRRTLTLRDMRADPKPDRVLTTIGHLVAAGKRHRRASGPAQPLGVASERGAA